MEGHSRVEDIRLVYINECEMTFTYVVNFGTAGIQNRKLIMPTNVRRAYFQLTVNYILMLK